MGEKKNKTKSKTKKNRRKSFHSSCEGSLLPCHRIAFRITSVISFTPKTSTSTMVREDFTGLQEGSPHECGVFSSVPEAGICPLFPTLIKANLQIQLRNTLPSVVAPHDSSFKAISRFIQPLSGDHAQCPDSSFNQSQVLSTEQESMMSVSQVNYS